MEEGIQEADAFITVTGNDEENMLMALYAKMQGVKKIVAKVNEENLSSMVDSLGIDSVVSPKLATADTILGNLHLNSLYCYLRLLVFR